MTFARTAINAFNQLLNLANLKLESQTAEKQMQASLQAAVSRGAFEGVRYPIPACFKQSEHQRILQVLPDYAKEINNLKSASTNQVGYQFQNDFYSSPDAEVLYAFVRSYQPNKILELGCGNSTRITRQALRDGKLATQLICLDPYPRRDVVEFADELHLKPVEDSNALALVRALNPGDVLFIDTSHDVRPANDCAYIYGVLIPEVKPGVIVHIHDIFLPFEYPARLALGDGASWGEQTVVAVLLQDQSKWDAIWPGRYLQHTLTNFADYFPNLDGGIAQSLWLRKR